MKIFTKYNVLYLVLTGIILFLANFYLFSHEMYKSKAEKIDENYFNLQQSSLQLGENERLLLVIGNSYVRTSFRPEAVNQESLDTAFFTVHGMPMNDVVGIVEHLPKSLSIDSIIIGLGYDYSTPVGGDSSAYAKYFSNNILGRLWSSIPLIRGRSMSVMMLREDLKCIMSQFVSGTCQREEGMEESDSGREEDRDNMDQSAETIEQVKATVAKRYAEYTPFTQTIGPGFSSNLALLKSACDQRGISLFLYTAPIYRELREKLDAEVIRDFRQVPVDLGIKYIDMNTVFPDLPASAFTDATHVNPASAGKLTTTYLINNSGWVF